MKDSGGDDLFAACFDNGVLLALLLLVTHHFGQSKELQLVAKGGIMNSQLSPTDPASLFSAQSWLAEVKRFEVNGEFFKAYDLALRGLSFFPEDRLLAHRAVLCLAYAGASKLARKQFIAFGLAECDATDFVTLDARLLKDEANHAGGEKRTSLLLAAAQRYESAYICARDADDPDAYYPGINLATLYLLAGKTALAEKVAQEILLLLNAATADTDCAEQPDEFWRLATMIEAYSLLGNWTRAKSLLAPALIANANRPAELASTVRQLHLIVAAKGLTMSVLGDFSPPQILHYSGHMIAKAGQSGRLHAEEEAIMSSAIRNELARHPASAAYGSLACGADILFAEVMLELGISLNIILPFALDEFIDVSVRPGGEGWVNRFHHCLAKATTVRYATSDRYLGDDHLFVYCSQLAMGLAVLCARHLSAPVRQLAIWDGQLPQHFGGTATDIAIWRRQHLAQTIIRCGNGDDEDISTLRRPSLTKTGRGTRAMLFGDIKGFSKLEDAKIPVFTAVIMRALGIVIDGFGHAVAFVNTWGDGLFLVCEDAGVAARCALALQDAMMAIDLVAAGLPAGMALRLGGHLGPIYQVDDPVTHRMNYMGAHVSRAARIEPVTPEGCVYVTETFAAVLALHNSEEFDCDYVGMTDMAKQYGQLRMFLLRRTSAAQLGAAILREVQ